MLSVFKRKDEILNTARLFFNHRVLFHGLVVSKLFKSQPTFQNINFRVPYNSTRASKYLKKVQ